MASAGQPAPTGAEAPVATELTEAELTAHEEKVQNMKKRHEEKVHNMKKRHKETVQNMKEEEKALEEEGKALKAKREAHQIRQGYAVFMRERSAMMERLHPCGFLAHH